MPSFILPFDSPDSTLGRAGGKGMNLAGLAQAGFPVPPGFIVATEAYRAFVDANRIQDRILAAVKAIAPDDPAGLDSASTQIAALFAQGDIPAGIADAIAAAYHNLAPALQPPAAGSSPPVSVRSSATAEDLPGLSF